LKLDAIGISAYFQLTEEAPTEIMSISELEICWKRIFDSFLIPLQNANPDSPILFTEFGQLALLEAPWGASNLLLPENDLRYYQDTNENGFNDGEEVQANILSALFNVNAEYDFILKGLMTGGDTIANNALAESLSYEYLVFSYRDRLAEDILRWWFDCRDKTCVNNQIAMDIFKEHSIYISQNTSVNDPYEGRMENLYSMIDDQDPNMDVEFASVLLQQLRIDNSLFKTIYKILFDEAHDEINTLSWERALFMNPENPGEMYYGALRDSLSDKFEFTIQESRIEAIEELTPFDIFMVSAPLTPFSNSEIKLLNGFLESGKQIVIMGDPSVENDTINDIITTYGISFDNSPLFNEFDGPNPILVAI